MSTAVSPFHENQRSVSGRLSLALALASFATACFTRNPAYPDQDATGTSGTSATNTDDGRSSSSPDTSTAGSRCESAVCEVGVPPGWEGPFRASEPGSSDSPAALELFRTLNVPPWTCQCSCGPVNSPRCANLILQRFSDDGCNNYLDRTEFPQPADDPFCLSHTPQGSVAMYPSSLSCAEPDSCPTCPVVESDTISAVAREGELSLDFAPPVACDGQLNCYASDTLSVCITRPGDHQCPLGFEERSVLFEDVDDSRSCTPCSCSTAQGTECTSTLSVFSGTGCEADEVVETYPVVNNIDNVTNSSTGCVDVPAGGGYQIESVVSDAGMCFSLGGQQQGNATPAAPRTVCCT